VYNPGKQQITVQTKLISSLNARIMMWGI